MAEHGVVAGSGCIASVGVAGSWRRAELDSGQQWQRWWCGRRLDVRLLQGGSVECNAVHGAVVYVGVSIFSVTARLSLAQCDVVLTRMLACVSLSPCPKTTPTPALRSPACTHNSKRRSQLLPLVKLQPHAHHGRHVTEPPLRSPFLPSTAL